MLCSWLQSSRHCNGDNSLQMAGFSGKLSKYYHNPEQFQPSWVVKHQKAHWKKAECMVLRWSPVTAWAYLASVYEAFVDRAFATLIRMGCNDGNKDWAWVNHRYGWAAPSRRMIWQLWQREWVNITLVVALLSADDQLRPTVHQMVDHIFMIIMIMDVKNVQKKNKKR